MTDFLLPLFCNEGLVVLRLQRYIIRPSFSVGWRGCPAEHLRSVVAKSKAYR
jgi:hypothetical protein